MRSPVLRKLGISIATLGVVGAAGCSTSANDDTTSALPEGAPAAVSPPALEAREPAAKTRVAAVNLSASYKNRIAVKFRERSGIYPERGELRVRAGATQAAAADALGAVNEILAATTRHAFVR